MNLFKSKFFILLLMLVFSSVNADVVFVSTKTTKMYSNSKFNSEVKEHLSNASELEVLQKKGRWLKVRHFGTEGWVSKYAVSTKKPIKTKISILSRIKSFFGVSNRQRVSVVTTSGGIRGLSDGEIASSGQQDFKALEVMENIQVKEDEIKSFIANSES